MKTALLQAATIGAGGFIGALARYGLIGYVHRHLPATTFPYGTLVVNLTGCLLIGMLTGLVQARGLFSPEFRAFALIGVLGAFTTFSTFGYETFAMLRDGSSIRAVANVAVHIVLGVALVWLGYALTTS